MSYHFFLEDLKILLLAWHVENFKKEHNISDEMFRQIWAYTSIGGEV